MNGLRLAPALLIAGLAAGSARAEEQLFIYNWSDYTSPELITKFETETGIKVRVDTYDTNETLLAKLRAGSAGYDIVVVTSDFLPIFVAQNLLAKIDAPNLPGYQNIEKRWQSPVWDPGNVYTVPWVWGVTSFTVNTKRVTAPADSLKLLFDPPPEAKGKIGMFGSPSEVISLAEVYLGLAPCQTDPAAMKAVQDLLLAQAPSVEVYNSDGIIERQASGETWISQEWNGAGMRTRLLNADIKFVYPKEGAVVWMDNVVVPASAKNPANARKFLRFLLQPENMALESTFSKYLNAITGSSRYFEPAMRDAPEMNVPADLKLVTVPACPEPAIRLMDRIWTRLKR
jgi:spermidine/putrescine transport system substrate-binding protein